MVGLGAWYLPTEVLGLDPLCHLCISLQPFMLFVQA